MDRPQAEALATFITRVRPDWRHAGIVAAIEKVKHEAPTDVARALVNLAEDMTLKTPALLAGPGGHWRKPDGTMPMRRGDNDIPCPEHPGHVQPCEPCKAGTRPPTPDELVALRAVIPDKHMSDKAARERLAKKEQR